MTRSGGFTLTELLIVVALIGIILALSGPPLADYVRVQRLKGISAELSTDLAFARSEAVSRGTYMQMRVQSGSGLSCYIIYARPDAQTSPTCDCTQAAGSRCTGNNIEVKTVVVPQSQQVTVSADFAFVSDVNCTAEYRQGLASGAPQDLTVGMDWDLATSGFGATNLKADLNLQRNRAEAAPGALSGAANLGLAMKF